ncbi:sugar ABC transporter permease [Sphaerochaeta sp. PS]|uniref:carbohydrate ABC transporter permease n=1 Tax=Sphaerochaeta sp. PS TaxID=3076336 RepID=UPI0028A305F6|nr:sugar ABC transporter permease [Sphaerochaeta sp. PS]MDT4762190.1 sugar ABC transporter permease [Sphaerochaeta sp. PS]
MKPKPLSSKRSDTLFSLLLDLPAFLLLLSFIVVPIVDSVIKSFQAYGVKNIITKKPGVWNDFANYLYLFKTDDFVGATLHTFSFVIGVVLVQFLLAILLALILNSNIRGARFMRSVMMTPWVVPTVISALIWMWLFQPQYGLLKYLVSLVTFGHLSDFAILNNPSTALTGVGVAALWKQIPLMTLLLLAGLQNVPQDISEAAMIDGAGKIRRFFSIILPYLSPVIKVSVSMSIIENFKQFPLFWTMTGGGPNNSTTTLAVLSYREAFVGMNLGSGAAITTLWMLMMIAVIFGYNKLFRVQEM